MMQRSDTWRSDLSAYIHRVAREPFIWGKHDCALFAAGAVEAMTGTDVAADFRGRYKTEIGAARALKKAGFDSHVDMAASLFEEIHVSQAQVGDIAVLPIEGGHALGVVQGPGIYVVRPDAAGVGLVDLLDAERAFRVPSAIY